MITYIDKPANISIPDTDKISHETGQSAISEPTLASECVQSTHGFIVTAFAFEEFLTYNSFHYSLHNLMQLLDIENYANLSPIAETAQLLLLSGKMPPSLQRTIINAYHELGINEPVVVDSHNLIISNNGPREDTRYEHRNTKIVFSEKEVLDAVKNCFAALYTGDLIKYRQNNGCVHDKAALSITIQKIKRLPLSIERMEPGSVN